MNFKRVITFAALLVVLSATTTFAVDVPIAANVLNNGTATAPDGYLIIDYGYFTLFNDASFPVSSGNPLSPVNTMYAYMSGQIGHSFHFDIDNGITYGQWDRTGILTSQLKAAADAFKADPDNNPQPYLNLGVAKCDDYNILTGFDDEGNPIYSKAFHGNTINSANVVVQQTFSGDLNLDGVIGGDDYTAIDTAYAMLQDPDPANHPSIDWVHGDINYDGTIDALDYTLMDYAYAVSTSGGALSGGSVSAVPEPSTLILLVISALMSGCFYVKRLWN